MATRILREPPPSPWKLANPLPMIGPLTCLLYGTCPKRYTFFRLPISLELVVFLGIITAVLIILGWFGRYAIRSVRLLRLSQRHLRKDIIEKQLKNTAIVVMMLFLLSAIIGPCLLLIDQGWATVGRRAMTRGYLDDEGENGPIWAFGSWVARSAWRTN